MKTNRILPIALLFFIYQTKAQVGISLVPHAHFTPHESALLHLEVGNLADGSKKGFLQPRVSLTSTLDHTTISSPIEGLLVYNISSTSGINEVKENNVYKWDGTKWDRYYSRETLTEFLKPNNFYLRSSTEQTMTGTTLSDFNSGTYIPITYLPSEITIANDTQVQLINSTEFEIQQDGIYDIAGFFNYLPNVATSSSSSISFMIQINKGTGWTATTVATKAIEWSSGDTYQSIALPSTILTLNNGDLVRVVMLKPAGLTNHGNYAGIIGSGMSTKSFRISLLTSI